MVSPLTITAAPLASTLMLWPLNEMVDAYFTVAIDDASSITAEPDWSITVNVCPSAVKRASDGREAPTLDAAMVLPLTTTPLPPAPTLTV